MGCACQAARRPLFHTCPATAVDVVVFRRAGPR